MTNIFITIDTLIIIGIAAAIAIIIRLAKKFSQRKQKRNPMDLSEFSNRDIYYIQNTLQPFENGD